MRKTQDKKQPKKYKKPITVHKEPKQIHRESSIKQLRLENLQKPKTLLILYYKDKRLSIPVFAQCDNSELFIRRSLIKFEQEILGCKKTDSLKNIVSFRTTDRDVLKDHYIWLGRDISLFKILELEPMWRTPITRGFSNFEIYRCIGHGGFSKVYLARRLTDGCFCALKVIDKKLIKQENRIDMVRNEDQIMRLLNHPFIVKMIGSFETNKHVVFVLQYCPGGELFYHLRKLKKLSEAEAKFYFVEILLAFEYLHEHKVLYRDIKPENIMMDGKGHLILADFGLAKVGLGKTHKTYSFCGSHEYMAPEMVQQQGHNYMLDYYCLGALLYEFVVGFPPFYSHDKDKIFDSIKHEEVGFPETAHLSPEIKWIISDLLKKDPRQRLGSLNGVREILSHPWLKKSNTRAILNREIDPPIQPNLLEFNVDEKDIQQHDSQIRDLYSQNEVQKDILSNRHINSSKLQSDESRLKPKGSRSPPKKPKNKKRPTSNVKRSSSNHTIKRITSNSKLNVNISINKKIQITPKSMNNIKRVRSVDHLSKTTKQFRR